MRHLVEYTLTAPGILRAMFGNRRNPVNRIVANACAQAFGKMCNRQFALPLLLLVERQDIGLCQEALSPASPQLNSDDRRGQVQAFEPDLQ